MLRKMRHSNQSPYDGDGGDDDGSDHNLLLALYDCDDYDGCDDHDDCDYVYDSTQELFSFFLSQYPHGDGHVHDHDRIYVTLHDCVHHVSENDYICARILNDLNVSSLKLETFVCLCHHLNGQNNNSLFKQFNL